jgi:hypothetical protein
MSVNFYIYGDISTRTKIYTMQKYWTTKLSYTPFFYKLNKYIFIYYYIYSYSAIQNVEEFKNK